MLPRKKNSSPLLPLASCSVRLVCPRVTVFIISPQLAPSFLKKLCIFFLRATLLDTTGFRWYCYVWSLSINCKKVHLLNAEYEQKDVSVSVCVSGAEHKRAFSLLGRLSDHDLPCITHRPWSPTVADFIMHDSKNAWGMI